MTILMLMLKGGPIKKLVSERLKAEITEILDKSQEGVSQNKSYISSVIKPHLAVILIGNNPRSKVYIEQKRRFAEEIGADFSFFEFDELKNIDELLNEIKSITERVDIHGIILQLPLPKKFSQEDTEKLINIIPHEKDVDGLTTLNAGHILKNSDLAILPATTRGILEIFKFYNLEIKGKNIVIIGRSDLVGKPTAMAMLKQGATITICHRETKNLEYITKSADILIVAVGSPNLITSNHVSVGQVIIDVGISVSDNGQIQGDVNPIVLDHQYGIFAITPVPGGVGPMTVAGLFLNLIDQYKKRVFIA